MEATENEHYCKADDQCKEYETQIDEYEIELKSVQESHEKELNEFLLGIKERDDQVNELRKEAKLREEQLIKEHQMMKHDRDIYEKYISDLEMLLKQHNINYDKYNKDDIEHDHNHMNTDTNHERDIYANNENQDPRFIIRKLRMEIIKYKTDINSSSIVKKLRDTKHKLEEKVINLRTDKAKQLVTFSQEKHKLENEISELQRKLHNMMRFVNG